MPINDYDGETFVAFLDISGFKELMKDEQRAWKALDKLYGYGYEVLARYGGVEGSFISDCGILFVRSCQDEVDGLKSLLCVVKEVNQKMLEHDFMLRTSIAYGRFKYQERIEFEGIDKNPIYGNAYVSTVYDNEKAKPRIQPGQCRIVKENLPVSNAVFHSDDRILRLVREKGSDINHYYFYWMVNNPSEIGHFDKQYEDSYNLKYAGMLKALKSFCAEHNNRSQQERR